MCEMRVLRDGEFPPLLVVGIAYGAEPRGPMMRVPADSPADSPHDEGASRFSGRFSEVVRELRSIWSLIVSAGPSS